MQKSDEQSLTVEAAPSRARGRPRAFDRDAALRQAMLLFWRKGYEATSISELTEAMGIGSPSLYAAFGSKDALYAEALRYYGSTYEMLVWGNFNAAGTARDAVIALLMDSAAALSGSVVDIPCGCMVALSTVGSEGHAELGELVRSQRSVTYERLKTRLDRAVTDGEISPTTDITGLARFLQTVQFGMSILARDGAGRMELEDVATVAIAGMDARIAG